MAANAGEMAAGTPSPERRERPKISFSKQQLEEMKSSICELEAVDEITSYTEVLEKLRPVIGKMRRKGVKLEQIHKLLKERFGLGCTIRTFKNCLASATPERRGRKPKEAAPVQQAPVQAAPTQKHEPAQAAQQAAGGQDQGGGFSLDQWDFSGVKAE